MPTKQTNTPIQLISAWTGALIHHTEFVTFLRQSEDDDEKNGEGERDGEGLVYTSEYKKWYPGHVGPFVSYLPPSSRALHDACRRSHSRMRFLRPTGGIERIVELGRNEGFGLHPSSLASWAYLFCPRAENQKRKAQLNERTVADHGIRKNESCYTRFVQNVMNALTQKSPLQCGGNQGLMLGNSYVLFSSLSPCHSILLLLSPLSCTFGASSLTFFSLHSSLRPQLRMSNEI